MTFIEVWLGYTIFGAIAFSLVFVWAVRNRQFSDLDRGRYIPLEGAGPEERCERRSRADVWGLRLMIGISLGLLAAAVVLGIWNGTHS